MDYRIETGRIHPTGDRVMGVILPADAFSEDSDDSRFPAPAGFIWGEGVVVDGEQFVELRHLCGEPTAIGNFHFHS